MEEKVSVKLIIHLKLTNRKLESKILTLTLYKLKSLTVIDKKYKNCLTMNIYIYICILLFD